MNAHASRWLVLVVLVAACSDGGEEPPQGPGPGDVQNHFPLAQGDRWRTELRPDGQAALVAWTEVAGTQDVAGTPATVLATRALDGAAQLHFVIEDEWGVLELGNEDPMDTLTPLLIPYYAIRFPLEPGQSFTQYQRSNLDLNGDGRRDIDSISATGAVKALETVTVPAGRFSGCAHVERTVVSSSRDPYTGESTTVTTVEDTWYAPGVGRVRQRRVSPWGLPVEEVLTGYEVGGERHGVLADLVLASGLGTADSNLTSPGRPAIAFRAGEYAFVTSREAGLAPAATLVSFLDPSGAPLRTSELDAGSRPSIASNGVSWLLGHGAEGGVVHTHLLDATGAPVGPPLTLGGGYEAAVASDGVGWLVVWAEFTGQYDVRGALVAADGSTAGAFTVFAASGEQVFPAVAFDGENYLVAWRDTRSGSGPSADTHLYATRVSPAGVVLDPAGIAIATGPGVSDAPAIASDGSGALVAWGDYSTTTFPAATMRVARVAHDGTLLDGPASAGGVVVEPRAGTYGWPSVAVVGADYLITWAESSYEPTAGIYAARVTPAGALLGSAPIRIAPPSDRSAMIGYPAITSNGEAALVPWVESFGGKSIRAALVYPSADR